MDPPIIGVVAGAAGAIMALLKRNRHPALEAGWREVDHSLHQMSALLKREGVPFRVIVFPMPEQVWSTAMNISSYQARLQAITNDMTLLTLDLARQRW